MTAGGHAARLRSRGPRAGLLFVTVRVPGFAGTPEPV